MMRPEEADTAMTASPTVASEVSAADIADDQRFFDEHPGRRYRIGARWVVRRRGADVFLRAPIIAGYRRGDDTEGASEQAWWLAAWPHLDPHTRAKMAKAARSEKKQT